MMVLLEICGHSNVPKLVNMLSVGMRRNVAGERPRGWQQRAALVVIRQDPVA
jgi:hypothetical protein